MVTGLVQETKAPASNGQLVETLQQRLNDPRVADGLVRLLDRADSIAFALDAFEGFVARGDTIVQSVASAVSELKRAQGEDGESCASVQTFLEKAPEMLETGKRLASVGYQAHLDELESSGLVDRLTQPETLKTLHRLLDQLPLLAVMMESLDEFLKRGDTIADNLAGMVQELKRSDVSIDLESVSSLVRSLPKLQEMGEHLLDSGLADEGLPKVIDAGVSMLESGMLDKDVVAVLGELGRASVHTFVDVKKQNPQPIGGLWAMMRATKDPDVQKTLGFFFAFAKAFSKHLK